MLIRAATEADLDALLSFEHIGREALARCARDGFAYAVELDGKIVGVLRYSLFWQAIPFLDLIFLAREARGKGIGTGAMRFWEARMRECGYRDVMTSTQADETAWFFYEKLGYRRVGGFHPPGQEAEELIYSKRL
ncbi:MAG TPA: GNAT family N-acetyltransferase [Clostridia bacterium]|nr:GNAT family N-acetyltransferase [Clostridia bacterium]